VHESTPPSIEFSPRADRDLDEIVSFLLRQSRQAAERFAEAFDQTTARLVLFPESGAPRPRRRRIAPVANTAYVISYRFRVGQLLILGVKHGAQR
jgi:plasmid stabilization system protein ParE